MAGNYVTLLTIIAFTLALLLEGLYSYRKKIRLFDVQDTLANIFLGLLFVSLGFTVTIGIYYLYEYLYQYRLFNIQLSAFAIVVLILLDDLINYVSHRILHENRFFWAVHEVHHSSENFNFTTGIRLTIATSLTIWPFWIILPILGFKTEWILLVASFSHLYGLLVHTRSIDRLGILEKVLVTPSHHRVHHGKNIEYLDRNYGVIFIFWDKLFNTFAEEKAPVEYGILHPEKSKNPIRILINPWINLVLQIYHVNGWKNRLRYLWHSPGWSHDGSSQTAKQMQQTLKIKI